MIAQGIIAQCFGNWQGNEMTVNFIVIGGSSPLTPTSTQPTAKQSSANTTPPSAPTGSYDVPFNGSFNWPAGTPLSAALTGLFKSAFPSYPAPLININPALVLPATKAGAYRSLSEFAQWLKPFTQSLIGASYPGVDIRLDPGNQFFVYDGTAAPAATSAKVSSQIPGSRTVAIQFQDLIGQPVWIDTQTIQFKCPMRADVQLGDNVTLPQGYYGISPAQIAVPRNYRDTSTQQGTFTVTESPFRIGLSTG